MDRRRVFYYLLLNIFISACVTGTILYWYDRNVKATSSSPAFLPQELPRSATLAPQPTVGSGTDIPVKIVSVVGSGTLGAEVVIIHYLGDGQLDLTNWQLRDENGNIFLFPAVILAREDALQIHSAAGTNTMIDLYWGMTAPVWRSGEKASLYDAAGNLIMEYKVP